MEKIAYLIKSNIPDNDPRLIKEINSLYKFGYNINIISWNREDSNVFSKNDELRKKFNIDCLNFKSPSGPIISIFFWIVWWNYIFIKLLSKKEGIVHVLNLDAIFPALVACKIKNFPIIYEIMDTKYDIFKISNFIRNFLVRIDKIFMSLSDAVILVDEEQIDEFSGIPNKIIYDTALDVFSKNELNIGRDEKVFNILYVGILNKLRKLNLEKLYCSIKEIDDVKLTIAGYGDMVDDIEKWSIESNKVDFKGRISYDESLKMNLNTDLLVNLRDSDLFIYKYICGSKIWEAMMSSRPIIVNSNSSTANKVKKENCGIVINANNIDEIRNVVIKLKENKDLCKELGNNGREAFEKKYSWDVMEKRLLGLYNSLNK